MVSKRTTNIKVKTDKVTIKLSHFSQFKTVSFKNTLN